MLTSRDSDMVSAVFVSLHPWVECLATRANAADARINYLYGMLTWTGKGGSRTLRYPASLAAVVPGRQVRPAPKRENVRMSV